MPQTDSTVDEFPVKDGEVESRKEDEPTTTEAPKEPTEKETATETTGEESDKEIQDRFEKRYTQLKGETPEEYARSLEDAYKNSSGEALNLKQENRKLQEQLASLQEGKKPEEGRVDPALAYAQSEMERQRKEDWEAWLDKHPQVETDPTLRDQVLDELETQANALYTRTGRVPRMSEVLKRTARVLDLDDNSEETVAEAAKGVAGQPKSTGAATKKAETKNIPDKAYEIGAKMGLSKEDIEKAYK